jgi:hypothetical protein
MKLTEAKEVIKIFITMTEKEGSYAGMRDALNRYLSLEDQIHKKRVRYDTCDCNYCNEVVKVLDSILSGEHLIGEGD